MRVRGITLNYLLCDMYILLYIRFSGAGIKLNASHHVFYTKKVCACGCEKPAGRETYDWQLTGLTGPLTVYTKWCQRKWQLENLMPSAVRTKKKLPLRNRHKWPKPNVLFYFWFTNFLPRTWHCSVGHSKGFRRLQGSPQEPVEWFGKYVVNWNGQQKPWKIYWKAISGIYKPTENNTI